MVAIPAFAGKQKQHLHQMADPTKLEKSIQSIHVVPNLTTTVCRFSQIASRIASADDSMWVTCSYPKEAKHGIIVC